MNLLNEYIDEMMTEINGKIIPENIKKGVTIFNTEGTAEAGTEINNQDKEITENGTYNADEGYTGLGTVTVNIKEKAHLFQSIEDMNAKTDYLNGDIAIVQQSILQPVTPSNYASTKAIVWYPVQTAFFTETPSVNISYKVQVGMGNITPARYNTVVANETTINVTMWTNASYSLTIIYDSKDGHNYTLSSITGSDGTVKDIIKDFALSYATKIGLWLAEDSTVANMFEQLFTTYFNTISNIYEAKPSSEKGNADLYPSDYTKMLLSSDNTITYLPDTRTPIHLSDYKTILLKMGSVKNYYCMCDIGSKIYMTTAVTSMRILYDVISKKYYCCATNSTYYVYDKTTGSLSTKTSTQTRIESDMYQYEEVPATNVGFSIFANTAGVFDENSTIRYNYTYICDFSTNTKINSTHVVENINRGPITLVNSITTTASASEVTKNKTCLSSSGFVVGTNVTPMTTEEYDTAVATSEDILGNTTK